MDKLLFCQIIFDGTCLIDFAQTRIGAFAAAWLMGILVDETVSPLSNFSNLPKVEGGDMALFCA